MATIPAKTLTAGDTLTGIIEGEILEVDLVLDTPFYPDGYVDILIAGTPQRRASFELDELVTIA
jgi:hypothetical protein